MHVDKFTRHILRGGRVVKKTQAAASIAPLIVVGGAIICAGGARAADECGPNTVGPTNITCSSDNYAGSGEYPVYRSGIRYVGDGLTLILDNQEAVLESNGISINSTSRNTDDISVVVDQFKSITTSVDLGRGIWVSNFGPAGNTTARMGRTAGTFVSSGAFSYGILAENGNIRNASPAMATMDGGSINTSGPQGVAVYAFTRGTGQAIATMSDGSITTTGELGTGIYSFIFNPNSVAISIATLNSGNITTSGEDADGLYSRNTGLGDSSSVMNGGTIETAGAFSQGIRASIQNANNESSSIVMMYGGEILTEGVSSDGVRSNTNGRGNAVIYLDGAATVQTMGPNAHALSAQSTFGRFDVHVLGSSSVSATSNTSSAVKTASSLGGNVFIGNDVVVDGNGGVAFWDGDLIQDGADENAGSVVVTTSGAVTGDAILGLGNDIFRLTGGFYTGDIYGDDRATVGMSLDDMVSFYDGLYTEEQLRGVNPVDPVGQDDTFEWSGGVFGSSFFGGSGSDTASITTSNYDGTYHILDGGDDYSVSDGWVDTFNLNNGWSGSLNGANITNWEVININGGSVAFSNGAITAGVVNINGGGLLDGANNLVVTGNVAVSSGSRLVAGSATGTNVMQITGNLANSGTVDLRGPGGSAAAGDRLSIGGNYTATGGTILFDTVLGGSNATDRIVVGGNLGGSGTVVVTNVGGTGSLTTGDGIRLVQVEGTSAASALTLAGGAIDVGAFRYALFNGGVGTPGDQDWYLRSRARDIVAPTISMARVAQDMGLTSLGTLHERVGEQEQLGLQGVDSGFLKGMWGRAIGKSYSDTARSSDFGDSRSNNQLGGLQMGVDLYRAVSATGARTHFGMFGGHLWSGSSDLMVTPVAGGPIGQTRSDGWVMGGYMTHYTASNFYVDAVIQHDWIDHRASAQDGTTAETRSRNLLASVEVGKAFGTKWKFEPQAQLIYSVLRFDRFSDSVGIANLIEDADSGIGRAGFRLKRTYDFDENSNGGLFTIYGKANVWHRIDGGSTTLTVGVSNPGIARFRESWGDVGIGTTFSLSKNAAFFADAEVEYGIDQGGTALNGRAGIRVGF